MDRISYTPVFVLVAIMPTVAMPGLFLAGIRYRPRPPLALSAAQQL